MNIIKFKSKKNKFRFVNIHYEREINSKLYSYLV